MKSYSVPTLIAVALFAVHVGAVAGYTFKALRETAKAD